MKIDEQPCTARVASWRASLDLAVGNVEPAAKWWATEGLAVTSEESTVDAYGELVVLGYAHLLLAQGEMRDVLDILEEPLARAEQDGRMHNVLEILVVQAICLQALNRRQDAIRVLARALMLAEPEGYVRIFIDRGPAMAALLRTAGSQGHAPQYVDRLLASFGQVSTEAPLDPLSERELQVLGLMADGLTNAQISHTLTIALSTVKTHVNRIYSKLDVRSRTQAVALARKMRLIS